MGGWGKHILKSTTSLNPDIKISLLQKSSAFESLNPTLHHRRIQETPIFPYSALRAARQNFPENEVSLIRAAGEGIGPSLEASKAPVLPLDDPAITLTLPYRIGQSKFKGQFWNTGPAGIFISGDKAHESLSSQVWTRFGR